MYVSSHIDIYMYVIVLSLPLAALQFKKKNTVEWKKKRSYTSECPPSVAIKSWLKIDIFLERKKDRKEEF